jgi:drug/metabolite transporter (DMT)-like permease
LINLDLEALRLSMGWGEFLATLAPLCVAAGIIILKPLLDRSDAQWVTGLALLSGACFLIPLLPLYGLPAGLGWPALLVVTAMGVVRGSSWLVYNVALQQIGAARSAILFITFAFFTVLLQLVVASAAPVLGLQLPTNLLTALIGGGLMAAGVVLLQTEAA